jgi:DNA-binding transcriptional regulator GbsR (MarR family)
MIEAGGRTAQTFGLNRLVGQIYVLLYMSKEPLSLDSLAENLGVSKASVSVVSRQLLSWGAVKRIWKKGDRKDYYVAESNIANVLANGLLDSVSKKLESARIQIERSLRLVEQEKLDADQQAFLRQKLEEAERRRAKVAALLSNPLVRSIL